jgi:S1-C subfamily serine protease
MCLLLALVLFALADGRPARAESEDGEKVYQRLLKSAVWVISPVSKSVSANGSAVVQIASGSGSLLDAKLRLILTNYHAVADREQVSVLFPVYQPNKQGKLEIKAERDFYTRLFTSGKAIRGKVLARSPQSDLALLQLESVPADAVPLRLAPGSVSPGQRVHSIGNPGRSGALWVYTSGTVRQVYHKQWSADIGGGKSLHLNAQVIETQSPTNPGDSGGPLVNDRGELVGVTQGRVGDGSQSRQEYRQDYRQEYAQLLSTFIDVSEVKNFVNREHIRLSQSPALAHTAPTPNPPAASVPAEKVSQVERDALRKLKMAKMMADDGLIDKAKVRLQEILELFPDTKAAEEARHFLEKLNK